LATTYPTKASGTSAAHHPVIVVTEVRRRLAGWSVASTTPERFGCQDGSPAAAHVVVMRAQPVAVAITGRPC
jgi:hypothetical protein